MVREAVLSDNTGINKLGTLLNPKYETLFKLKDILTEDYSKIYVYEKDGEIIGFIHATVLYETIDIINIVVDPKYRREKIASNLFDYLLTESPSSVKTVTLEVNENNISAIKFYESFDFKIINIRKKYYGNDNAYLMGRRLK